MCLRSSLFFFFAHREQIFERNNGLLRTYLVLFANYELNSVKHANKQLMKQVRWSELVIHRSTLVAKAAGYITENI